MRHRPEHHGEEARRVRRSSAPGERGRHAEDDVVLAPAEVLARVGAEPIEGTGRRCERHMEHRRGRTSSRDLVVRPFAVDDHAEAGVDDAPLEAHGQGVGVATIDTLPFGPSHAHVVVVVTHLRGERLGRERRGVEVEHRGVVQHHEPRLVQQGVVNPTVQGSVVADVVDGTPRAGRGTVRAGAHDGDRRLDDRDQLVGHNRDHVGPFGEGRQEQLGVVVRDP